MNVHRPLIAVVGQTATGKSEVAAAIAEALEGDVVGADAYQIYRGLDIGTAKPSPELRRRAPHHLVDALDLDQQLSLAQYLDLANEAFEGVWARGRVPVLCGGSGQYVWAVIEGWQVPRVPPDNALRAELEAFGGESGAEALHLRLAQADPVTAARIDHRNVRRVIRALEVIEREGRPLSACQTRIAIDAKVLVLGLRIDRARLHGRIDLRVDAMFSAGFVEEVRALRDRGWGDTRPVRGGIGYKEVSLYLDGRLSLEDAVERTKTATHRLARNQAAWFKAGDERIHWLEAGDSAPEVAMQLVRSWLGGASSEADHALPLP